MLTPQQIVEYLTVDEFIGLCQMMKPYRFDIMGASRYQDRLHVVVKSKSDNPDHIGERLEVKPWPISA